MHAHCAFELLEGFIVLSLCLFKISAWSILYTMSDRNAEMLANPVPDSFERLAMSSSASSENAVYVP